MGIAVGNCEDNFFPSEIVYKKIKILKTTMYCVLAVSQALHAG